MLEYVLEGVFHIAKADGVLHPQEEQFLRRVAKRFGFTDAEFTFMKARHTIAAARNPYDVLGVKPSVSDDELSGQFHRLVAESQPYEMRLPKEFVLVAREKRSPRSTRPMTRSPKSAGFRPCRAVKSTTLKPLSSASTVHGGGNRRRVLN